MNDSKHDSVNQMRNSLNILSELAEGYSIVIKEALLGPALKIDSLKNEFEKINSLVPKLEIFSKQFNFESAFREAVIPATINFKQVINDFTPRAKEVYVRLGEYGWYFDDSMPISAISDLESAFAKNEVIEIESNMSKYYANSIDRIKEYLTSTFPHRAEIISAAFRAHDKEEYNFSVPIFLMQADGICAELVKNKSLFRISHKKPAIASHIEEAFEQDSFERAIFIVLESVTAINMSEPDRPKDRKILNRHQIIHGESLDYGTKTNSLKAISFINYVAQSLIKLSEVLKNNEQRNT